MNVQYILNIRFSSEVQRLKVLQHSEVGVDSKVIQRKDIPQEILSLTTMAEPNYADLFTVTTGDTAGASPEQWARVALDGASPLARFLIWQVVCGLRLEMYSSPDYVAGWAIADRGDTWIRLESRSWLMTAHAIAIVGSGQFSIALFVSYDNPVGELLWPPISIGHRQAMPGLLRHAPRRMKSSS